jgi:hypothetical protein
MVLPEAALVEVAVFRRRVAEMRVLPASMETSNFRYGFLNPGSASTSRMLDEPKFLDGSV